MFLVLFYGVQWFLVVVMGSNGFWLYFYGYQWFLDSGCRMSVGFGYLSSFVRQIDLIGWLPLRATQRNREFRDDQNLQEATIKTSQNQEAPFFTQKKRFSKHLSLLRQDALGKHFRKKNPAGAGGYPAQAHELGEAQRWAFSPDSWKPMVFVG